MATWIIDLNPCRCKRCKGPIGQPGPCCDQTKCKGCVPISECPGFRSKYDPDPLQDDMIPFWPSSS